MLRCYTYVGGVAAIALGLLVEPLSAARKDVIYSQIMGNFERAPHTFGPDFLERIQPYLETGNADRRLTQAEYEEEQLKGTPTPPPPSGAFFSGVFSDSAVLQRQPAQAAVYGVAGVLFPNQTVGGADGATVTVDVKESTGLASYSVTATVAADGSWKAMLHASPAGGDYTLTATCSSGCTGNLTAHTIRNVTFGDVWFCAGCDFRSCVLLCAFGCLPAAAVLKLVAVLLNRCSQSNMQLGMENTFTRNFSKQSIEAGDYHNIRMVVHPQTARPDGQEMWIVPPLLPPPPPAPGQLPPPEWPNVKSSAYWSMANAKIPSIPRGSHDPADIQFLLQSKKSLSLATRSLTAIRYRDLLAGAGMAGCLTSSPPLAGVASSPPPFLRTKLEETAV